MIAPAGVRLVPDVPSRWQVQDGVMQASEPARADLPFLRFADVRIELDLKGQGQVGLLLEPVGTKPVEIDLSASTIAVVGCSMKRERDAQLVVERHGDTALLAERLATQDLRVRSSSTRARRHCDPSEHGLTGELAERHALVRRERIGSHMWGMRCLYAPRSAHA